MPTRQMFLDLYSWPTGSKNKKVHNEFQTPYQQLFSHADQMGKQCGALPLSPLMLYDDKPTNNDTIKIIYTYTSNL